MKAKVIKSIGNNYTVLAENGEVFLMQTYKTVKLDGRIIIGDNVEISLNPNIITKVYPRKNQLFRPIAANIDQLLIVVSPVPEPDFYLIDKLILNCYITDIEPVLIINKTDIAEDPFIKSIIAQYKECAEIIKVSAKTGTGVAGVKKLLSGKVSAFAGQSAVGKSAILNKLDPNLQLKTNEVSERIKRGQHTTRLCEIYVLSNNILIADTPGFSMLDCYNIEPPDLPQYYPDFEEHAKNCRYNNCTHVKISEKECGVISALNKGLISKERYNRYAYLYQELKERWEKRYD